MKDSHRMLLQSFMSRGILNGADVKRQFNAAITRFRGKSPILEYMSAEANKFVIFLSSTSVYIVSNLIPVNNIWPASCQFLPDYKTKQVSHHEQDRRQQLLYITCVGSVIFTSNLNFDE